MSAQQISDIFVETVQPGVLETYRKSEWLIDSSDDLSDIPQVAPGSVAYMPDLSYMAMYDGTQWIQIGGGEK